MRLRFLLLVTVAVALLAGVASGEVKVLFSPRGGCDQALVLLARSAQMYLDAACYAFSLDPIADELIAANKRGVKVRVILDRMQSHQSWCPAARLLAAGIPVRVNSHGALMHDKFLVADGHSVATGSYNWSKAGTEENDENLVLFIEEVPVASTFAVQFDKMWSDTARFAAFIPRPSPELSPEQAAAPPPQVSPGAGTDTVYITKTGTKYHRAGCRYLAKSSIPITRKDAQARGYAPCKVCKP